MSMSNYRTWSPFPSGSFPFTFTVVLPFHSLLPYFLLPMPPRRIYWALYLKTVVGNEIFDELSFPCLVLIYDTVAPQRTNFQYVRTACTVLEWYKDRTSTGHILILVTRRRLVILPLRPPDPKYPPPFLLEIPIRTPLLVCPGNVGDASAKIYKGENRQLPHSYPTSKHHVFDYRF